MPRCMYNAYTFTEAHAEFTEVHELMRRDVRQVWDEWWGDATTDDFPTVLKREKTAGRLRIKLAPGWWDTPKGYPRMKWFGDDLHKVAGSMLACWEDGRVYINNRYDYTPMPCLGASNPSRSAYDEAREIRRDRRRDTPRSAPRYAKIGAEIRRDRFRDRQS